MALAKERAEKDQQTREELEKVKMGLQNEKRRVEEDLAAERALNLDKDAQLERSKKRESELEEDVLALQADLDTLDSQLDRALQLQKQSEEQHETLKQAFDQAAEHLVRLEREQQEWQGREAELNEELAKTQALVSGLERDRAELEKISEDVTDIVRQREDDLARLKDRSEGAVKELEGRLATESQSRSVYNPRLSCLASADRSFRDLHKNKADGLEEDLRRAREQLSELARTATDYSKIIKEKEVEVDRVRGELDNTKRERARLQKHVTELEADLETLSLEIDESKQTRDRDLTAQSRLQIELDQLRALLEAKTSEETKRSEVERRKEAELVSLRSEVSKLQRDIADARTSASEAQNRLKVDLDTTGREYKSLQQTYTSLLERERGASSKLKEVMTNLSAAEKIKRSLESDLQSARSRQNDTDSQLAEVQRAKEVSNFDLNAYPLVENSSGPGAPSRNFSGETR